ncbi:HI1506-related protein [Neptunomonas japonica]|uniref:HI1506-related protein n=1 Tax=Neptunomonas japonica TaxID=417574 RepID=UPI00041BB0AD|nr:HI1506-related protein [Neptunomonas japonica]
MPKNTHASHIRIIAAVQGFRRAGIAHPAEPTTYPVSDFSKGQLEQLQSEPRLVVEFVEAPEADQADNEEGSVGPDGMGAKLEDMTVAQLKEIAAAGEIAGFSSMKKDALIEAIRLKRDWMGQ